MAERIQAQYVRDTAELLDTIAEEDRANALKHGGGGVIPGPGANELFRSGVSRYLEHS